MLSREPMQAVTHSHSFYLCGQKSNFAHEDERRRKITFLLRHSSRERVREEKFLWFCVPAGFSFSPDRNHEGRDREKELVSLRDVTADGI